MSFRKTLFVFLALSFSTTFFAQSIWEELSNSPMSSTERMFSFEINDIIYLGCGRDDYNTNNSEVWAYDAATDSWEQLADFPGIARRNAVAFSVGDTGYMGLGFDGTVTLGDFWKYDSGTDSWEQLADFPGGPRSHSLGISGDDKGYLFAGGESVEADYFNDLWEFDASAETWSSLGDMPGAARWRAYGWRIDNTIYVGGGGEFPNTAFLDFYAYDLNTQTWTTKAICPTDKTSGGFYFQINGKGYFLEGASQITITAGTYGKSIFAYNPQTNLWANETDFIGDGRVLGFNAVVDGKAILGTGRNYIDNLGFTDVYSFTPDNTSSVNEITDLGWEIYPNPVIDDLIIEPVAGFNQPFNLNIYDMNGGLLKSIQNKRVDAVTPKIILPVNELLPGIYNLEINIGGERHSQLFLKM